VKLVLGLVAAIAIYLAGFASGDAFNFLSRIAIAGVKH
jgi:hypothetical protein